MEDYILHKDYVPRNAYADIAVVFLKPGEGEFLLKEQSMFSPDKCNHQIYPSDLPVLFTVKIF